MGPDLRSRRVKPIREPSSFSIISWQRSGLIAWFWGGVLGWGPRAQAIVFTTEEEAACECRQIRIWPGEDCLLPKVMDANELRQKYG